MFVLSLFKLRVGTALSADWLRPSRLLKLWAWDRAPSNGYRNLIHAPRPDSLDGRISSVAGDLLQKERNKRFGPGLVLRISFGEMLGHQSLFLP